MYCGRESGSSAYHEECYRKYALNPAAFSPPAARLEPIKSVSTKADIAHAPSQPLSVRVVDVEMTFASMVTFMVKWAIASIPALFLLAVLVLLLGFFFRIVVGK